MSFEKLVILSAGSYPHFVSDKENAKFKPGLKGKVIFAEDTTSLTGFRDGEEVTLVRAASFHFPLFVAEAVKSRGEHRFEYFDESLPFRGPVLWPKD